jgi:hypothetical protein
MKTFGCMLGSLAATVTVKHAKEAEAGSLPLAHEVRLSCVGVFLHISASSYTFDTPRGSSDIGCNPVFMLNMLRQFLQSSDRFCATHQPATSIKLCARGFKQHATMLGT